MIKPAFRSVSLALVLGATSLLAVPTAFAQGVSTGTKVTTADGITGTDPMPTGCGCGPKSSPKLVSNTSLFFLK